MHKESLRALISEVDRADQKAARAALGLMVATGRICEDRLDLVATTQRNHRKTLASLTVQDLIDMGIVTAVPSNAGAVA